ncbi:MAG: hypothetical protein KF802_05915 [Bdellovibrionaceae bacterium]|nr:hypothetical protein [Pseudobdellovibrionaceae bacterium]MBX3032455.1 hypothetical protein [Pseudobdellovibrionaceae bacterium]
MMGRGAVFSGLMALVMFVSLGAEAQGRRRAPTASREKPSRLTYDLSGSAGSYNGSGYNEITLGLNWFLQDWMNWRNAVFTRQGQNIDSVQGLDSSLRFSTSFANEEGSLGLNAFAGPGVRLASRDNSAVFGEAGVVFRLGGLSLGGGVKALNYIKTREDSTGAALPKGDTQFFIILGGSGSL